MSGPTDYVPISLDAAVAQHIELNGGDPAKIRARFQRNIDQKKAGATCGACGAPVWALGGCGLCFSCTTGEANASNDYEFEGVCW